jgi:hypothetical protein
MIYGRIVICAAIGLALAAAGWRLDQNGYKRSRAEWTAEKLAQSEKLATFNENQRLIERGWQSQLTKAQNERIKKEQDLQPVIAASHTELVGLRGDIYSLDTNASRESTSTCIARASTARDLFEQCAQKYSDLATKADRHAADAVMLLDAWPK